MEKIRSFGKWSDLDYYYLTGLKERGDTWARISQHLDGRTAQACQQAMSSLRKTSEKKEEKMYTHLYWKNLLQQRGMELPPLPEFSATLGLKARPLTTVEILVGDNAMTLGIGSDITTYTSEGVKIRITVG